MDESGEHHPQQTDTRTENETLHILTHRWELNSENMWTQGEEHHTPGSIRGARERQWGLVRVRRDNVGRNAGYR